jgi:polysaccharide pyruvyl transferase WcaK-like protein
MRIMIETGLGKGIEEYGNMGDISMLQVCVDRLHRLFPEASLEVLTDSADNLARYCPLAKPIDNRGRAAWFANSVALGELTRLVPKRVRGGLASFRRGLRSRSPSLLKTLLIRRLETRNRHEEARAVEIFLKSLGSADLLALCGAGGFYDGSQQWNLDILDLLEAGIKRGIPVILLGQGFGPLNDRSVLKRAAKILPSVDLITLRGGRGSLDLLQSLGISASRILTTGDEALELAYESRSTERGEALGVNIRFMASAWTDEDDVKSIKPVLHEFARRHGAPIIPLPIAIHRGTRDDLAIKEILTGFDDESDGGAGLDSPLKVIQQVAGCRVVVTGAYHAAVFALAQGIPVVALAKSDYFAKKLSGLEDQFGEGCQIVSLKEPDLPARLNAAIERAWQNADEMRERLQTIALRQIELSRQSYEQIQNLAAGRFKALVGE